MIRRLLLAAGLTIVAGCGSDGSTAGSESHVTVFAASSLTDACSRVRVHCEGTPPVVADVTHAAVTELDLREGSALWASVKATEVTVVAV